jgi:hypothetical protein
MKSAKPKKKAAKVLAFSFTSGACTMVTGHD